MKELACFKRQLVIESDLLERLARHHVRMITEHFRVRFGDMFLQSLKATYVKNIPSPRNTTYPIPLVKCLGHDILVVYDKAVEAKKT
jgi:hypothetical protein